MIAADDTVRITNLRTDDESGLACCGLRRPALAWRLEADRGSVRQLGFEVQRCASGAFGPAVQTTGRIASPDPFGAPWPGPDLSSRELAWCRVRVWTDHGLTGWSAPLRIEGALFALDDWLAQPISPFGNAGQEQAGPVPLLRRAFRLAGKVTSARLFVSALGVHECRINGQPISRDLFDPGWTSYGARLLYASHDVTGLLTQGENVLSAAVADGWWRGNLTWLPRRAVYGDTTALIAQLEVTYADGGGEVIATDQNWRGGEGALREADFYNGCTLELSHDDTAWRLPGFDDSDWSPVVTLPMPAGLEQRTMPPVCEVMRFPVRPIAGEPGQWTIDCGQNLTGYLRLSVRAEGPARIVVRHAEVLEPDGSLHLAALRTARATDEYRLGEGEHVLAPSFTWHGFRYAEIRIEGAAELLAAEACVVASDLARTGHFACSDERLNRLYQNIVWSQRGNFLSIPTDCPQRDERLGWTGDIQVFAPTACANFDARAFLSSWLTDLAIEQRADGNVPSVVPNVIQGHPYEYGGVGWADAATLVPWAVYEAYGDKAVLARQLPAMRRWVDYGASRLNDGGVWAGDFHLGDWLDPGAPPGRPEEATTDRDYIASCYLAHSARIVSLAAEVLGDERAARRYSALGDRVADATWRRWRDTAQRTQAGCAIALVFAIAPQDEHAGIGARLAALVEAGAGRVATGFLGTPLVLPALTLAGQHQGAWRLLMNEAAPGWLYQVARGATTMWERWDAILPDGSIHGGDMDAADAASMISFNHYAYGCVGAWLYRTVAGIAPDARVTGYRLIRFAPVPGGGVDHAEARIETPFGQAAISWQQDPQSLTIDMLIPPGAEGCFACPPGWRLATGVVADLLGSGRHHFVLSGA